MSANEANATLSTIRADSRFGSTIEFRKEMAVVVARWVCGELAVASYPHIHGGGGEFFGRAGGVCGGWRLV